MKEIKLTIDGKEVQLTDEQLKQLGIDPEKKRKNPFERVNDGGLYYFINCYGDIKEDSREDDALFNNVNYFNNEGFAKQVALHQLLYRKLLKFSYDNGYKDAAWDAEHMHWYIYYNMDRDKFDIDANATYKQQGVYFSTSRGAERAIKEVIEPFMKEHPDFVW